MKDLAIDRREEKIADTTAEFVSGDHYESRQGSLNVVREKPYEEGGYI